MMIILIVMIIEEQGIRAPFRGLVAGGAEPACAAAAELNLFVHCMMQYMNSCIIIYDP